MVLRVPGKFSPMAESPLPPARLLCLERVHGISHPTNPVTGATHSSEGQCVATPLLALLEGSSEIFPHQNSLSELWGCISASAEGLPRELDLSRKDLVLQWA